MDEEADQAMATTKKKPVQPPGLVAEPNGLADDVLTLAETATYLRVNEADVIDLIHGQDLPARLIGNEWRFLKAAIQQWLSSGSPTQQTRKAAQLALAGKYKDDPDLMRICEEAFRQRAEPTTEDE
jgi:excisionase family DNA binding protein